ncbi:MAG: hypothetical protein II035_04880 [Firmicutes bacterium]|nr:hypothetical protein [Bacillota bacterium]MBQ1689797.1 hypothetical protein [Bacillota bacterium]MBQ1715672.1 hypothetical protein [Bacillota bacterium]
MKKHIRFFAVMLIFLMVFTLAGCGGTGGSGDSGDANEKLVALSEAFNGLDMVKQYQEYDGYTFESAVSGDTLSVSMGYGEDVTTSDFILEGDVLTLDGGMNFQNLYSAIAVATAKAVMDGNDEKLASAALSHSSALEMTLEDNGLYMNPDEEVFQMDLAKEMTLMDMSDVYVTLEDLGERDENATSYVGHSGLISYRVNLNDYGDSVLMVSEPGELTERAYKSLLSLVEFAYGKEAADEFAAKYPEITEASFDNYTVNIDPENEDYQELYDDGDKVLELVIAQE